MYDWPLYFKLLRCTCVATLLAVSTVAADGGFTSRDEVEPKLIPVVDDDNDSFARFESAQAPAHAMDPVQSWAERFYLQRSLCGASEVREVAIDDDSVLVRLDIDPKWEVSLNKLDEKEAGHWFAIHCPLPVASAEHALGQRDIRIVSASANNPHTSFSCRAFEKTLAMQAAARKGGFRTRVNALLQRIGATSR